MRYLVQVCPYGDSEDKWIVTAPAFGVHCIVDTEDKIEAVARKMIARCGAAAREFEITLQT